MSCIEATCEYDSDFWFLHWSGTRIGSKIFKWGLPGKGQYLDQQGVLDVTPQSCERIRWFCKSGSRGLWTTCGFLFSITYKTALCFVLCTRFILTPGIVTIFIVKTHIFLPYVPNKPFCSYHLKINQCTTTMPTLPLISSVMPAAFKIFFRNLIERDLVFAEVLFTCSFRYVKA